MALNCWQVLTYAACPIEAGFVSVSIEGGCFKVVLEALNWTQSQARCAQLDPRAHLAVIKSKQQNRAMVNYLNRLDATGTLEFSRILLRA